MIAAVLAGRSAVVTGAARGLGLAAARRLAQAGASVTLTDRDAAEGEAQAQALRAAGLQADFAVQDVTDPQSWPACSTACSRAGGGSTCW